MYTFTALTAFVAVLGLVDASPVDLKKRAFSVAQVEHKKVLRNGPAQKAKTFRKYGKVVPQALLQAAAVGPNGTVPATPSDQYDVQYLSPVDVGGSVLNLDFDTGSADLWVYSNLLPAAQRKGHDVYIVNETKKVQGATWAIRYGDGSGASGTVYADKVVVGGVTATTQSVEAATSVSTQFQSDTESDGLLGLSFGSLNTIKPKPGITFFDNVRPNLAKPLFAVTLKYHAPGTYDFGWVDTAKYSGDITYVPVNTANGFWEFPVTGYAVGTGATTSTSLNAIADTGTTLAYLPAALLRAYYGKVSGATNSQQYDGWVFPCSATLPSLSLVIGGVKQTIPGKYINYAPVTTGSSTCYGGAQSDAGIGFSILGDIFLKSKFVVHEAPIDGSPRIGFAEQK